MDPLAIYPTGAGRAARFVRFVSPASHLRRDRVHFNEMLGRCRTSNLSLGIRTGGGVFSRTLTPNVTAMRRMLVGPQVQGLSFTPHRWQNRGLKTFPRYLRHSGHRHNLYQMTVPTMPIRTIPPSIQAKGDKPSTRPLSLSAASKPHPTTTTDAAAKRRHNWPSLRLSGVISKHLD